MPSSCSYAGGEFEVVEAAIPGASLVGVKYTPLFPYFQAEYGEKAFRVVADTYVTDDAGTGVVHQAPAFGEDDWRVCVANGVIEKDKGTVPCPIDVSDTACGVWRGARAGEAAAAASSLSC